MMELFIKHATPAPNALASLEFWDDSRRQGCARGVWLYGGRGEAAEKRQPPLLRPAIFWPRHWPGAIGTLRVFVGREGRDEGRG